MWWRNKTPNHQYPNGDKTERRENQDDFTIAKVKKRETTN